MQAVSLLAAAALAVLTLGGFVQPWEVVEVAEITVVQGPAMTPGQALGPVKPQLVPIPILEDLRKTLF